MADISKISNGSTTYDIKDVEARNSINDLATVAISGDYNDLTNKLTAGTLINIDSNNEISTSASKVSIVDWESDTTTDLETLIINKLSKQQYDQLPEKADDELYMITSTEDDRIIVDSELDGESENPVQNKVITTALGEKVDSSSLANVAISGDYNDLINKPTSATILVEDYTN